MEFHIKFQLMPWKCQVFSIAVGFFTFLESHLRFSPSYKRQLWQNERGVSWELEVLNFVIYQHHDPKQGTHLSEIFLSHLRSGNKVYSAHLQGLFRD